MKSLPAIRLALSAFAILLSLAAGAIPSSAMAASAAPLNPDDLLRQMAPMLLQNLGHFLAGRPQDMVNRVR